MGFYYVFIAISVVGSIINGLKAMRAKQYLYAAAALAMLPFMFFFLCSYILGGSAANDAATHYELYEAGHYYLVSHGTYTEVTYSQFRFMEVLEIVGLSCWAVSFITSIVANARQKKSK